nr:LysR family transcriptional regulator [uncultured Halomonas sp.]
MKSYDLKVFEKVAELGSIQSAADRVGLTPSAVTRVIQRLENDLGAELFDRTAKPLKLTSSGRLALVHARRVLASVSEMAQALAPHSSPSGPLRVGVAHAIAPLLLMNSDMFALPDFPEVQVIIRAGWSQDLIAQIRNDALAGAFVLLETGHHPPPNTPAERLSESDVAIVGAATAKTGDVTIAELNQLGWALNPDGCGYRRALATSLNRLGLEPNIKMEVNSIELQLAIAQRGMAYTLLPMAWSTSLLHEYRVSRLNTSEFDLNVTLFFVHRLQIGNLLPPLNTLAHSVGRRLIST